MAEKAALRLKNIVSVAHGSDTYKGVRSVNINVSKGTIKEILEEGEEFPSGAENVGMPQFPVTGSIVFETDDDTMLDLLTAASGSLVITKKAITGGTNKVVTILNVQFTQTSIDPRSAPDRTASGPWPSRLVFQLPPRT